MPKTGFAISALAPIADVVEVARAAEAQGYESFWLTEGAGGRDAIAQLAFVAAHTTRIKLGTGVLTLFSRTSTAIAQAASCMQELSNGRFILGLGTGHKASVERTQGLPFARPVTRMRDYIRIARAAWRDGHVTYQGAAVSIPDFRMTSRPVPAPIYIACLGGKLAEVAGEMADGVVPLMASPQGIERLREAIAAGAARARRPVSAVDVGCFIVACASDDNAAADAEARRQVGRYASLPFYQRMLTISGFAEEIHRIQRAQALGEAAKIPDLVSSRMLDAITLRGDAARWRATLDRYRSSGVTNPIVYAAPVGKDQKSSLLKAVRMLSAKELG